MKAGWLFLVSFSIHLFALNDENSNRIFKRNEEFTWQNTTYMALDYNQILINGATQELPYSNNPKWCLLDDQLLVLCHNQYHDGYKKDSSYYYEPRSKTFFPFSHPDGSFFAPKKGNHLLHISPHQRLLTFVPSNYNEPRIQWSIPDEITGEPSEAFFTEHGDVALVHLKPSYPNLNTTYFAYIDMAAKTIQHYLTFPQSIHLLVRGVLENPHTFSYTKKEETAKLYLDTLTKVDNSLIEPTLEQDPAG